MCLVNSNKGISVVVCCYNSATRLPETLTYLFAQIVEEGVQWEVLVIDNASTDNTAQVAQRVYEENAPKVDYKIIHEKQPGLNYARLAGLRASAYDYLIWVDDDNWLQPNYISTAYSIMERNSNIGVLGGIGLPVLEGEVPHWFDKYQLTYAVGKQAPQPGEVKNFGFLYGAGAVIRKAAWLEVIEGGFESVLTDRKGNSLYCGGDVEIENAIRLAGYVLWYDERLVFKHFIPKERLTWNFLLRTTKGSGESDISATVFYFIFRIPGLTLSKFRLLYYKRLIWLFVQVIKSPRSFLEFLMNRYNTNNTEVIEVNRNLANLISSIKNREIAFFAFKNIIKFKNNINYSPVVSNQ